MECENCLVLSNHYTNIAQATHYCVKYFSFKCLYLCSGLTPFRLICCWYFDNICVVVVNVVFAIDQVFHAYQPVGAILADSYDVARKAAPLVQIEYEELDAIVTIDVRKY